jgi:hypothetical protein
MMATYSSAQTTPMAAAVIRAGTKDPHAWTMNPVTVDASAPPKYPPKFCIAPSDAVVFAGAATEAIAQAEELATYPRNIAADRQHDDGEQWRGDRCAKGGGAIEHAGGKAAAAHVEPVPDHAGAGGELWRLAQAQDSAAEHELAEVGAVSFPAE